MSANHLYQTITTKAIQSLLYEAVLYPKPGLVDPLDNGSHSDMTIFTFMDSSASLYPGFYQFLKAGIEFSPEKPLKELFIAIRDIGKTIEQDMLRETHHINTHKGAIFSFGIFLTATGYYVTQHNIATLPITKKDSDAIFDIAKEMVEETLLDDFKDLHSKTNLTHGETLFVQHGITGIRGLAIEGYLPVKEHILPFLRHYKHLSLETKLHYSLLLLMTLIDDSNIIHRSDVDTAIMIKHNLMELIQDINKENDLTELLIDLNTQFIQLNISPGGAADLLALSIFLAKLEGIL